MSADTHTILPMRAFAVTSWYVKKCNKGLEWAFAQAALRFRTVS